MTKLLRFCAAVALVCVFAAPAFALDTTMGSPIDLAPVLNPLIQLAGLVLAGCAVPAGLFVVNWLRNKMHLSKLEANAALVAKLDDGAAKFIGGAVARAEIQPGQITIAVKNQLVADAGNRLAQEFGDTIKKLGSDDVVTKAREIVENRVGLMQAAAAGTPIPNPSAPATAQAAAPAA